MEVAFLPLKNNPKITLQKIFPFYMIRFFHAGSFNLGTTDFLGQTVSWRGCSVHWRVLSSTSVLYPT